MISRSCIECPFAHLDEIRNETRHPVLLTYVQTPPPQKKEKEKKIHKGQKIGRRES